MSAPHYTAIVFGVSYRDSDRHFELGRFKKQDISELYDLVDGFWIRMGWKGRSFVRYIDPEGNRLSSMQLIEALGAR